MMGEVKTQCLLLAMILWLAIPSAAQAQEFSVASFRLLPNDVSAFINNVRDLNDEACALIKVVAPSDFAFSSPLGIVKRKDEVLRDYRLGKPLESRMTYEMKLNLPKPAITELHDTIVEVKTITDTIAIEKVRPKMPLSLYTLATVALHKDGPSYGVFLALMRRHGFFLHASSNLKSIGSTEGNCDKEGFTGSSNIKPYYSGETRYTNYTLTAGAIHHITHGVCLFEGVGYGKSATAWQLSESEGKGYLLNDGLSDKGVTAELGTLASFGKLSITASAITIAGKQWQGCIGIGIKLGK